MPQLSTHTNTVLEFIDRFAPLHHPLYGQPRPYVFLVVLQVPFVIKLDKTITSHLVETDTHRSPPQLKKRTKNGNLTWLVQKFIFQLSISRAVFILVIICCSNPPNFLATSGYWSLRIDIRSFINFLKIHDTNWPNVFKGTQYMKRAVTSTSTPKLFTTSRK